MATRFLTALMFVFSLLVSFTAGTHEAGSQEQPPTTGGTTGNPQTNEARNDDVTKRLMDSLDQLIPGGFDEKSDRYKKLLDAVMAFRSRKPNDCSLIFDELRKADPAFPPKTLLLAGLFFSVNDANSGRALLEKTVTDFPEYPATYAGFGRMAINSGRVTDADALLEMMKSKMDAGTWTKEQTEQFRIEWLDIKTDIAIARSRFDKANGYLVELAKLLPENGKVPLRQAEVAFKQKQIDQALVFVTAARSKQANVLVPPLVIANWYRQANDRDNLETWVEKAAKEHSDDRNVQLEYSRWLIEQGKLSKANIWINKAEENGANEFTTTYMKGQVAFLKQSFDVAELHFARIQAAQPANVDATNLLALSLVESGNIDKQRKALELATVSVRMAPNNISSASVLGWIYLKTGDPQRAAQHLGKVSRSARIPPESAYFVAKFLMGQNRKSDALKVLEAVTKNRGVFLYRTQANALLKTLQADLSSNPDNKDGKAGDQDK